MVTKQKNQTHFRIGTLFKYKMANFSDEGKILCPIYVLIKIEPALHLLIHG